MGVLRLAESHGGLVVSREPKGTIVYSDPDAIKGKPRLVFNGEPTGGDGDSGAQITSFTVPSGSRKGRFYGIEVSWVCCSAVCPCEGVSYNYDTSPVYENDPECFAPTKKSKANWEFYATDLEREYFRVYGRKLPPSILRHPNGLCVHLKKVQRCMKRRTYERGGPTYFAIFKAVSDARAALLRDKPDYVKPQQKAS